MEEKREVDLLTLELHYDAFQLFSFSFHCIIPGKSDSMLLIKSFP